MASSVASLRVFGDELVPEEITKVLGCAPTKSYLKGNIKKLRSGRELVRKTGGWFLDATPTEPEDLDGQVAELIGKLTEDLAVWAAVTSRFEVDLFCGWFMKESNEGVSVSVDTLRLLGERGIELSLDIYGPDGEDGSLTETSAQQGVEGSTSPPSAEPRP